MEMYIVLHFGKFSVHMQGREDKKKTFENVIFSSKLTVDLCRVVYNLSVHPSEAATTLDQPTQSSATPDQFSKADASDSLQGAGAIGPESSCPDPAGPRAVNNLDTSELHRYLQQEYELQKMAAKVFFRSLWTTP